MFQNPNICSPKFPYSVFSLPNTKTFPDPSELPIFLPGFPIHLSLPHPKSPSTRAFHHSCPKPPWVNSFPYTKSNHFLRSQLTIRGSCILLMHTNFLRSRLMLNAWLPSHYYMTHWYQLLPTSSLVSHCKLPPTPSAYKVTAAHSRTCTRLYLLHTQTDHPLGNMKDIYTLKKKIHQQEFSSAEALCSGPGLPSATGFHAVAM